ncbi:MAG: polysaccharide deacetylase family protein [Syntrophaceae bacterium]|nr:polysaccharide deacetylase family protein [Syntrophaceae bacterium]
MMSLMTAACADFLPMGRLIEPKYAASTKVPILMYHDISYDSHDEYTVTPSMFAAQMEWLYSNGYQTVAFSEIDRLIKGEFRKPIIITFDDGYASYGSYAFPFMQRYKFKATINAIGNSVGSYVTYGKNRPALSWDEYRYYVNTGLLEVGCHTFALHEYGYQSKWREFEDKLPGDLKTFQKIYTEKLGKPAQVIAWPYGFYTPGSIEIAKQAGFKYILGSENAFMTFPLQTPGEAPFSISDLPVISRIVILKTADISSLSRILEKQA